MVKPYVQVYVYSVYHFTSICNIHTCVYLEICTSLCSWNSYNPHIYIVSMHILMYIVTYYIYRYSMCVCPCLCVQNRFGPFSPIEVTCQEAPAVSSACAEEPRRHWWFTGSASETRASIFPYIPIYYPLNVLDGELSRVYQ